MFHSLYLLSKLTNGLGLKKHII